MEASLADLNPFLPLNSVMRIKCNFFLFLKGIYKLHAALLEHGEGLFFISQRGLLHVHCRLSHPLLFCYPILETQDAIDISLLRIFLPLPSSSQQGKRRDETSRHSILRESVIQDEIALYRISFHYCATATATAAGLLRRLHDGASKTKMTSSSSTRLYIMKSRIAKRRTYAVQ